MNDRHIYRAWNITGKVMIHQDVVIKEFQWVRDNPDSYVLMQSTGLKDKNGKLIFESDIVVDTRDTDKDKILQIITWFRGGFMLQKHGWFGYSDIETYDGDCEYFEVIGNKYENGDLLK